MVAIAEVTNEEYRISLRRLYGAYVEQLERTNVRGPARFGGKKWVPFGGNTTSSLNIASNG
jgi:hypothetical protein